MNWVKKNKLEFAIILAILLIAVFLRFYKIDQYMNFLGDEGRDALMIKRILVENDYPLLGPPTSIGNMYLGPLYYYMMALPMAIFWMNPVAAAAQVALIGTLSVGLIYFLTRAWFGKWPAVIAAFLYAISPVNVVLTRSSWNPNPAPFFALLSILGLYKINQTGNFWWLVLTGVSLAFAVQMHYLALILVPICGILWLFEIWHRKFFKKPFRNLFIGTCMAIITFLILMSPLVIFDFKYGFTNYRAISAFFGERQTTVNLNVLNTFERIIPIYNVDLIGRYITQENAILSILVSLIILIPLIYLIFLIFKKRKIIWPILALGIWLVIGVLGLSLYKQNIYDHYLGFLNPVPYILLGAVCYLITKIKIYKNYLSVAFIILILILAWVNIDNSPIKKGPNNQLKRTQEISKYVIQKSNNQPYNFALLSKNNYDSAYQFYLDQYNHKPGLVPFEITDQLFVVCEDPECQPIGNPKYEIAGFGWAKIDSVSNFEGIKVYRLVHNYNTD
jgi:4-amino-4-deoxy-L-arabinose transferase-like glycosyltransferase